MTSRIATMPIGTPTGLAGLSEALSGCCAQMAERVRTYVQDRRDLAILMEMDDRTLRDAGLNRYDVQMSLRDWR
jgi:uncharacterized protein YjiS (DUF1127 family)